MTGSLEVRALRRSFPGSAPVLAGVDLEVPAGGCVALLGPSGSGKSTVLRLIAGLDTPDAGRVLIDGRDVARVPTEHRRTAMVFQQSRLFPHLDVRDNVAFPLVVGRTPRRRARRQADRFLELVGAAELATRRPASLSGGQEQRVALARALAADPDVLLLDEPFSALDPTVRSEMHRLLGELRAVVEPTLLLVTHDRAEAAAVADTVAVLLEGRIAQHDAVDGLYARPASLALSRFLGGLNELPGQVLDGAHHSPAGALELAEDRPDGPAVLVVRQEVVGLVDPDDPVTHVRGRVERVTTQGVRSLVEVVTRAGPLYAEAPPGRRWRPGQDVGLVLPPAQRWAVPAESSGAALADLGEREQSA